MIFASTSKLVSAPSDNDPWEVHRGPDMPEVAGAAVVLTPMGGPGLSTEDLLDTGGWQVRSIGNQYDPDSAENIAWVIDVRLRSLALPVVTLDGKRVISVQRSGSPPSPLLVDEAHRTHYVCTYYFTDTTT